MHWLLPPGKKVAMLEMLPLFERCSRKDLHRVAEVTVEEERPAGEVLTRQGEYGGVAYLIVSGEAEVIRDDKPLARLGPGDVVGELSLLDGGPRAATVRTTVDSRVLALPAQDFRALLAELPELTLEVLAVLASRLRHADERMAALL